jgi:NodT family efflux transporter outer membrane factor (OMF) lipoprotein
LLERVSVNIVHFHKQGIIYRSNKNRAKKVYCWRYLHFFVAARVGLAVIGLLLLAGCMPSTKRPVAPLELPETFSRQGELTQPADWWTAFHDPGLARLIEQSLQRNFTIQVTRDRLEAARAVSRQAGASLLPTLDGKVSAAGSGNSAADSSGESYFLSAAASFELDLWGRLHERRAAALFELQATEADYYTVSLTLAAEVARVWYQMAETTAQLTLLAEQKSINSKVLELITFQFRSGQGQIADVLQQRQLVESNSGDMAGLQADLQILEHQLVILLGSAPGTIELPAIAPLPDLPPLPDTGIPLELLTVRPDIRSSYLQLQAADRRVAAAVADRFPQLSLSADLATSGQRARDLFSNWLSSLAANLFAPLFDGGLRQAEVDRNLAVARQQLSLYSQTIIDAIGEVEDSLVVEKGRLALLASLEIRRKLAEETIEQVRNRYRQGAEDYQRVLLALLSHQDLQRSILSTRRQLIDNRIQLYRALSGRLTAGEPTFSQHVTYREPAGLSFQTNSRPTITTRGLNQ